VAVMCLLTLPSHPLANWHAHTSRTHSTISNMKKKMDKAKMSVSKLMVKLNPGRRSRGAAAAVEYLGPTIGIYVNKPLTRF